MNERIKELAEQAGFYVADDKIYIPTTSEDITTHQTRFAELIVRECIDVVVDVLPSVVHESKYGIHPAWHLKEHFGVEE